MDSPIKWPGGKHYLAPKLWEIAKTVPHVHRVEAFAGSLAFTLATDPEGYSEVVSDLNPDIANFWAVLRDPADCAHLQRLLQATQCSEGLWDGIGQDLQANLSCKALSSVDRAWRFFVRCRQSMAGRMKNYTPIARTRTRRKMNELPSAWLSAIEGLPEVHARLSRVVCLNRSALEMLDSQDGEKTLFYLDPPYLHDTRTSTYEYGQFEMTAAEHAALLDKLHCIRGKFLLSGYRSELYDTKAKEYDWKCQEFDLPNNASSGEKKRRMVECVWTNF